MFFFDVNDTERLWIHLHGFATNVFGSKIQIMREFFSKEKLYSFFAMDMDYEKHTTTQVLDLLEALIVGFSSRFKEITLCGSSHGAYVATNYVRFRKLANVKNLVLLAPSFETLNLIVKAVGKERAKDWLEGKESLKIVEEDREVEINPAFAVDIINNGYEIVQNGNVNFPYDPNVNIVVVHGNRDDIVPIESTKLFVSKVKVLKFIEVEDDHQLSQTFPQVLPEVVKVLQSTMGMSR